jgi:hypothetical protein
MKTQIIEHNTDPAQYLMLLVVSVTPAGSIVVKAGNVISAGKPYTLAEDAEFDPPAKPVADWEASGHLVVERTTGKVSVLVEDGVSGTPVYDFSTGPYDRLFPLWHFYADNALNIHNYGVKEEA